MTEKERTNNSQEAIHYYWRYVELNMHQQSNGIMWL